MTPASILAATLARGVQLWGENGELRTRAPKGAITPELRDALTTNKPEILLLLGDRYKYAAVSYAQQRLWFFDQLEPNASTYNMYGAYRLTGTLDAANVEASLNDVVARHETLRTRFVNFDGEPFQAIAFEQPIELARIGADGDDRAASAANLVAELAHTPFSLNDGPLLRAALICVGNDDHVLTLVVHHIVSDGWSLRTLMREFAAHYAARVSGGQAPVPGLTLQYADFARQQRARLESELDTQLAFWKRQLDSVPPLELPVDRPRPNVQTFTGANVVVFSPPTVLERMKAIGREEGATPFMTLLAAFQVLLARTSGQNDITVGSPIAGRTVAGTESLIGFFGNTLAMRVALDGNPTFREVLRRARKTTLEALQHQELPFEKLVAALQPERDMSRTPIFQVVFNMANFAEVQLELPGLCVELLSRPEAESKFDLTMYAKEVPEGARFTLVYNRDLFDEESMRALLAHYQVLLERFVADPDVRVWSAPVLSDVARERKAVNPFIVAQPSFVAFERKEIEQSIPSRFEEQARLYPHRVAVQSRATTWTYAELNERANRVAHALIAAGRSKGERVALLVAHDAPMLAGILGVLKAGLVYVPLDPAYPRARLEYMLSDSGATALVTDNEYSGFAYELARSLPAIQLDALPKTLPCTNPDVSIDPRSAAYILYTSGSTGQPKGVVQSHRNVLHFMRVFTNNLAVVPDDRQLLIASYSFDAAVMDIFAALFRGASLMLYSLRKEGLEPLARFLDDHEVSIIHMTPTVYRYFMSGLSEGQRLPTVRLVVLGGEEAQRGDLESFKCHFGLNAILVNGFGPTESSVTLQQFFSHSSEVTRHSLSIGYPVDDMDVLLISGDGDDAELFGEIAICSEHVALEYMNRPELTAAAFSEYRGKRLYRTGDLGRRLPDGSIVFVGRRDFQVKIRGHRIELQEIEHWLCKHESVRESVVVSRPRSNGDPALAAYVVARDRTTISVPALQSHLQAHLPEYMVPSAITPLESLPLTPTGKIDRRALPEPVFATDAADGNEAQRTPTEEILTGIWCDVLGVHSAGKHDRFFDLGGHSLKATQVMSRVRDAFGVDVPLRAMFESPTIAALAEHVECALREVSNIGVPAIERIDRSAPLPLSHGQQRLWFIDKLGIRDGVYTIAGAVRLRGNLDVGVLERAINEVVARHESLRTYFIEHDGMPLQGFHDSIDVPLDAIELGECTSEVGDWHARDHARALARDTFDLTKGPLFRIRLLRFGANENILAIAFHHIISDGWSLGVFVRDVAAIYRALSEGKEATLAPLSVQYADFAHWQRSWLEGGALQTQLEYWKASLADAPQVLELPTDRPRPAVQTFNGGNISAVFDRALIERLTALSQQEHVTLFMTLLAGFGVLLARSSGQRDVVIGSPIANRTRRELEPLIGFFVNTLPMRVNCSGSPAFRELLTRVRANALGAYAHQDVPFEKLIEALQPDRDMSRTPIFQVMINMAEFRDMRVELSGLVIEPVPRPDTESKFDLTLYIKEVPEGARFTLVYNRDLFEKESMEALLSRYRALLEQFAADPDAGVWSAPLLPERDCKQKAVNPYISAHPSFVGFEREAIEQSIPSRFEEQVRQYADRVAVQSRSASWTYTELNDHANRLAHALIAAGCSIGDRVALLVAHDVPMLAGVLGVLKAGLVYVPLDPVYPRARLEYMLSDSGATAVVTDNENAALVREMAPSITILELESIAADLSVSNPAIAIDPASPAYILYTSGSTGQPKGVVQSHRNVLHFMRVFTNNLAVTPEDRQLLIASYSFDAAVMDIFAALFKGASLVLYSLRKDGLGPLANLLDEHEVSIIHMTPTVFRYFSNGLAEGQRLKTIRLVVLGGEKALRSDLEWFKKRFGPEAVLVNGFGPTESSVTLQQFFSQACEVSRHSLSIGYPVDDMDVLLLGDGGDDAELFGEIAIWSDHVALEYLNKPEQTAAAFSGYKGRRLYRTGDLGRRLPDGTIEFVGRRDFQVKIRGHRIELQEIEHWLGKHEDVRECVVVSRARPNGDPALAAYVVARDGMTVSAPEVQAYLQEHLPEYMVPSAVMQLDVLPLTPTGKIDRRSLPAPEFEAEPKHRDGVQLSPTEEILAGIWCEVLSIGYAGPHERFFDLGGHSLKATQVMSRVRDTFGVDVPLRAMFEAPTIAGLVERIERAQREQAGTQLTPIHLVERGAPLPLSFSQQRLWFIDKLGIREGAYTISGAVRLRGLLDTRALEETLNTIVSRHEALRTFFVEVDGIPMQQFLETMPIMLDVEPLRYGDGQDPAEAARNSARAFAQLPFDLRTGPLFRACVLRVDGSDHVLIVAMHHIVSDGWSLGVLMREVEAIYKAAVKRAPVPLRPLALQYADYASWQREWLEGGALETQLAYWRKQLAGAPAALELPTDRPRPKVQSFKGARVTAQWPQELLDRLKAVGREEGATLFMTLLAGFYGVLNRYSGQSDIVVGSAIANRTRREIEPLIGFFVNTLPLRVDCGGTPDFRELVRRVRETSLGAYAHQDVPFERLIEEIRTERDPGRSPLVQVMFVLQNAATPLRNMEDIQVEMLPLNSERSRLDLAVTVHETDVGLSVAFEYCSDLFDASTIEQLLDHYEALLSAATSAPDESVATLPMVSPDEKQMLLVDWNKTSTDFPRTRCIHRLVEELASMQPDATAVIDGERRLSYGEFNSSANQLAHLLISRGVTIESPVCLCMERGADLLVAILAVLKAGGAYVPLDPAYPEDRLAFMLRDTAAPVTISWSRHVNRLLSAETQLLLMDALDDDLRKQSDSNPSIAVTSGSLAYIIYTSGSTGVPKGVCVEHRGVVRLVRDTNYAAFGRDGVFLHLAPPSFDVSTLEIWGPLLNGGCCVISPSAMPEMNEIAGLVEKHNVTDLLLTAGLFHQMVDGPLDRLKGVRRLFAGGDVISPEHCRKVLSVLPDTALFNGYGPTENTMLTTCYRIRNEAGIEHIVPIGRPISNTTVYVLDTSMQPVPIGVAGELYIGGGGVARGYWKRPDLDAVAFVPDPFSLAPGARLYRSGDIVRYRRDGVLEFLGRADKQVKIRGFRIELGEVEKAMQEYEHVSDAVAHVQLDRASNKTLVGYLVTPNGSLSVPALREYLRGKLPQHMVPSVFVTLHSLPLSHNGKVDRDALPNPYLNGHQDEAADYVAPSTPTEERVAAVWADVLGRNHIGIRENFLDIGGHSMLAVQMISRLAKEFSVELPLRVIFEEPTIEGLSRQIDLAVCAIPNDVPANGKHRANGESVPLTPAELVVTIRGKGHRTPVFLVAPAGGTVFAYYALAHHLGADQPVYALQDPAFDGRGKACDTIEEMATLYIEAMKTVQPQGPYAIGGWSFGGNVAFEVAQQLVRAGEEVSLLFMIEATASLKLRKKTFSERMTDFRRNISFNVSLAMSGLETVRDGLYVMTFDTWLASGLRKMNGKVFGRVRDFGTYSMWKAYTRKAKIAEVTSNDERLLLIRQPTTRRWLAIAMANLRAFRRYANQPYPGRIVLFKGEQRRVASVERDPAQGWSTLAEGGVDVHVVPGDHFSCLRNPHVKTMAQLLAEISATPAGNAVLAADSRI